MPCRTRGSIKTALWGGAATRRRFGPQPRQGWVWRGKNDGHNESKTNVPECGIAQGMTMPTYSCLFFHEYVNCKTLLRPKLGDDCVFCSYADAACPHKHLEEAGQQV
mgnify:CR=1 FL=1